MMVEKAIGKRERSEREGQEAGKHALLASWRDRPSAERFSPPASAGLRHRVVRVVRNYGMFDRRESPQYYPEIQTGTAVPRGHS